MKPMQLRADEHVVQPASAEVYAAVRDDTVEADEKVECESDLRGHAEQGKRQEHDDDLGDHDVEGMESGVHHDIHPIGQMMRNMGQPEKAAARSRQFMAQAMVEVIQPLEGQEGTWQGHV